MFLITFKENIMRKLVFPGKAGKIYTLGIFLVCGLLLMSVEECDEMSLAEQEAAWAQYQAAQDDPDQEAAWAQYQAGRGNTDQGYGQGQGSTGQQGGSGSSGGGSQTAGGGSGSSSGGSQTGTGSQGNSGSPNQGQQQGGGTSGGNASQSGAGAGGNQSQAGGGTGTNFLTSISGKEWKLSELRLSDRTIVLDRAKLNSEGAGDIFTMTVEGNRISGKAAPNRYNTAYQAGANNSLTVSPVVSTLMASSFDPERIQEHEYYQYLAKVKSWRINQNKLELYTTDDSNKEAVLVYVN